MFLVFLVLKNIKHLCALLVVGFIGLFRNAFFNTAYIKLPRIYAPPPRQFISPPKTVGISRGYKPRSLVYKPTQTPYKVVYAQDLWPEFYGMPSLSLYLLKPFVEQLFRSFFFVRKRKDCDQEMDNWLFQEEQALANSKVSYLCFLLIFVENGGDSFREILSFFVLLKFAYSVR